MNLLWKVEYLELSGLKSVTGQGLRALKSRSLKELNLGGCCNMLDNGVMAVVRNCPNIEKLDLSELHKLSDESIITIAETLSNKLVRQGLYVCHPVSHRLCVTLSVIVYGLSFPTAVA